MTGEEKNNENWFSRQSTVCKVIIVLFVICCVGIIAIFTIGSMLPDLISYNDAELKLYENEYISFKYPSSFIESTVLSYFYNDENEENIYFTWFEGLEKRSGIIVSCKEAEISIEEWYEYFNSLQREHVKNFSSEKVDVNGISAIKTTDEYYESDGGSYGICLTFIHDKKGYTFYFRGDDLNNLESTYKIIKSSIILKQWLYNKNKKIAKKQIKELNNDKKFYELVEKNDKK